ncbi:serine O-acetyltransferase [Pseudomonas urmiensis]|uniref:serine O-acetyltransferase n=1 Tax=Pseudomonas urmiensis TaxID=2745493 RepID=UPI003C98CD4A
MRFFANVRQDLSRYSNNGRWLYSLKIILVSHSFHLVLIYRVGVFLSRIPFIGSFLRVMIEYFMRIVFASDISLRSRIGAGLVIMHGHDIVIGSQVVIGRNCKILNGVTLGNKDTEASVNQQPVLGDNVIVGSGAKILGAIKLGDNVKVGANTVVLIDVPPGSTIVGVPGRCVAKNL